MKIYHCVYVIPMAQEIEAVIIAENEKEADKLFIELYDDVDGRYISTVKIGEANKSIKKGRVLLTTE